MNTKKIEEAIKLLNEAMSDAESFQAPPPPRGKKKNNQKLQDLLSRRMKRINKPTVK
jgi:hypothetical protein